MSPTAKLLTLSLAAALAVPAAAQASVVNGTVLQADSHHHVLRVVEGPGRVESFRYTGKLDARVRPGSVVQLQAGNHHARRIKARHRARRVQVTGRVVRSSAQGLTVSLPDGRLFQVRPGLLRSGRAGVKAAAYRQAFSASAVSVNVIGLQPGQLVMITIEYLENGDVNVTVALQPTPAGDGSGGQPGDGSGGQPGDGSGGQPACTGPDAADGKVLGVNHDNGTFTIGQRWSDEAVYHASPELLAHIQNGDQVLVRFDPADPSTASDVRIIHREAGAADPEVQAADGTVNRINADAGQMTVIRSDHSGALSLNAPCWALNQVWKSEDVHVIYHRAPSGDLVVDAVDANDGSEF